MTKPVLHVVNIPHTGLKKGKYNQCAFTEKTRKFCHMMTNLGYKVYVYANDENDTPAELVTCITSAQQKYFLGEEDWYKEGAIYKMPFDKNLPIWKLFNQNVIYNILERAKGGDLVLYLTGNTQQEIQRALPGLKHIEYGIGYTGIWNTPYKVFESYAWLHYNYGRFTIPDYERHNYTVIPNYFEVEDFPFSDKKEDYLLFMARPIPSKGLTAVMAIAAMGHKVKVAGAIPVEGKNIEYVGYADEKLRGELMSNAKALLSPTLNVEPFGGVAVEAMICGTPVIASPWGAFVETVEDGKTGFLCSNLNEMVSALGKVDNLNHKYISDRARGLYSTEVVAKQYDAYFKKIAS